MSSAGETHFRAGLALQVMEEAGRHLGTPVSELELTGLTGDASTRAYFRISPRGDAAAGVVVALYTEPFDEGESAARHLARLESGDASARMTYANDPRAHIEVTRLFLDAGLPVPRIVAALGEARALIFEDVGDVRLQDWLKDHTPEQASTAYHAAVGLIVKIQEAAELAVNSGSICSRLAFDEAKLRWELSFFFVNYFNKHLGVRLDPATANAVQSDFKSLCAELAARPRVLVHRDYHARNLMMRGHEMFIIDHQDARMGPASYDIASLVSDPYAALDNDVAAGLAEYFIEVKADSSVPIDNVAEFRTELALTTVQRMLKAVGTYAFQVAVKKNPVYVPYIEPAILAALASMKRLERFDATRALLERSVGR
ncbi:MAG TPA: phosphotransferase [Blastocatellia bacterium]|nr:phosphotransferase [Blastocatellia bacterium]